MDECKTGTSLSPTVAVQLIRQPEERLFGQMLLLHATGVHALHFPAGTAQSPVLRFVQAQRLMPQLACSAGRCPSSLGAI